MNSISGRVFLILNSAQYFSMLDTKHIKTEAVTIIPQVCGNFKTLLKTNKLYTLCKQASNCVIMVENIQL